MIAPASETRIRSATLTGYSENATAAFPDVDELLERTRAARAADEIDALVGAHVGDVQHGRQQLLLQDADVERADGIGGIGCRARAQRVPGRPGSTSRSRRAAPASPVPRSTSNRSRTASQEAVGRQRRRGLSRSGCTAGSAPGRAERRPPASSRPRRRRRRRARRARVSARARRWRRDGGRRRCTAPESGRTPRRGHRDRRRRPARACGCTPSGAVKSAIGGLATARETTRSTSVAARYVRNTGPGLRAERQHVPRAIVFLVGPRALVLADDVAIVLVERHSRRQCPICTWSPMRSRYTYTLGSSSSTSVDARRAAKFRAARW